MNLNKNKTNFGGARAGRRVIALLLALVMVGTALPFGGYSAYAEGETAPAQVTTAAPQQETTVTEAAAATTAAAETTTAAAAETTGTTVPSAPAAEAVVSASAPVEQTSGSDVQTSDGDAVTHICIIRGFRDHIPGVPYAQVSVEKGASLYQVKSALPRKMEVILDCADCPTSIDITWKNSGTDRFVPVLDEQLYKFVPLDDPATEDIDESKDSPYCDLPFAALTIIDTEPAVSGSDATSASDAASGSDVTSSSDAVSASDAVSGSDVVSGSDIASGSDVASGSGKGHGTTDGTSADVPVVSGSDGQVLPLCVCDTHCYANAEAGIYLVNINCPACSADPASCVIDPLRAPGFLETTASDGRVITVEGALPEGAFLSVETLAVELAAGLVAGVSASDAAVSGSDADTEICFAYDIKVIYEGREYQPSDFGETVTVRIHDVETEPSDVLSVYHFHEDEAEQLASALNEENVVSFETDGFSYYVGTVEKTGTPATVYIYRYRSEEGNTAAGREADKMYFYCSENGWLKHTDQLLDSNKKPFATIGAILEYFTTGDINFILQGTYIVSGPDPEIIDGTGRNITITRHRDHVGGDENAIDVGYKGKSLTLKNVTLDGINRALGSSDQAMVKVYNNGAVLNIMEGTVIKNGNSHGVLIMGNSTVNMSGGTIENCHARVGDTRGLATRKGGGVYVDEGCTFNMSGGTITGCSAIDAGGGVYIAAGAAVTGDATGNPGKMEMTGGTITGCSVDTADAAYGAVGYYGAGGGIYVEGAASTDGIGRVRPFAMLEMSGGSVSGNTAENGGGIANSGELTLSGGTISGNIAKDSGGGIFNSQTIVMTGGSILSNEAQGHSGGGMMLYGYKDQKVMASTCIEGGTISGNTAKGNSGDGGDGIMVYNYTGYASGTVSSNLRHHLMLTGTPTIADVISLGLNSDSGERDISIIKSEKFFPGCVIKLALRTTSSKNASKDTDPLNFPIATVYDHTGGHSSGSCAITDPDQVERVMSKFTMVNPKWYLKQGGSNGADYTAPNGNISSPYHIVIAASAANYVYYSKNAPANGDGTTPAKAFNTMAAAYNALKANGGTIYMVTDYETSGVEVMGCRSFSGEDASITTGGDVQLKRYVKPSASTYSSWAASNEGSLITVKSGSTLSLAGLTVDGHNREVKHQEAQINSPALTQADSAMIQVEGGGTLTVTGYTRLIDAPSSAKGGAIYAADTAAVNITDKAVFSGNSGTEVGNSGMGECVYVDGDAAVVTLSGSIQTDEGDFHAATRASEFHIKDDTFTTEDGVLDITLGVASHCYSGRIVAVYDSGTTSIAKLKVSNHEIDDFRIVGDGKNVILPHGGTFTVYAAPEGVFLDYTKNEFIGFGCVLNGVYEITAIKDEVTLSATARVVDGEAELEDYNVVEANADKWGTEKAKKTFGFEFSNGFHDERKESCDVFTGGSVNAPADEEGEFAFELIIYNANAITETKDGVATIEFDISVDGYVKTYTVIINTRGATMSVTVPIKITGVADTGGTIYMPSPEVYKITNDSVFPVEVTDIEWKWEQGADDMFTNVDAMSAQVELGGSGNTHSFAGNSKAEDITDGEIASASALELDWDMFVGADNYIKSTVTRHVATITYTIDAKRD